MNKIWKKSSKGFKLDHSVDDVCEKNTGDDSSVDSYPGAATDKDPRPDVSHLLETPEEKKARKRSHMVAYTTMFVMSIGFSIVLSGVWPYMKSIDSTMTKAGLGWVVAANPLGQMLASPLLGLWGNKAGSIRGACITTVIFFIGGNVMYAMLYAFQDAGKDVAYYMMIVARFIVGVSSANVTLCRSYLAGSTTLKERTTGIAVIAAAQALGFVVGPGIQAILTVVVKESSGSGAFVWDKYTSAGWVAAILGLINLVIVMPGIFQEFNIAEKERLMNNPTGDKKDPEMKLPKPDYLGITGILFAFFFVLFIYVLLETLAEPFVTDQYAVNDDYAMVAVGIALSAGGVISILMFVVTTRLAKKYDERMLLILMGMLPTVVGTFLYLPIVGDDIQMVRCNDTLPFDTTTAPTTLTTLKFIDLQFDNGRFYSGHDIELINTASLQNEVFEDVPQYDFFYRSLVRAGDGLEENTGSNCTLGCPIEQTWCNNVPQLPLAQLVVAYVITVIGYPVVQALAQAIFSKMLGPKPQGLWMGILTGVGSASRIAGPIFVSYVYTKYGTYWTFGVLAVGMLISMLGLVVLYGRIVPMKIPTRKQGYDNKIAEHEL